MKGDSVKSGGDSSENDPGLRYLIVDRNDVNDPMKQNEWTQKKLVWVPSPEAGFVQAGIKVSRKHFYAAAFMLL